MWALRKKITVTVKLFSGLQKELNIESYNNEKGIDINLRSFSPLISIVKSLGLPRYRSLVYFINGERVGLFKILKDGDVVSCLKPSGGG